MVIILPRGTNSDTSTTARAWQWAEREGDKATEHGGRQVQRRELTAGSDREPVGVERWMEREIKSRQRGKVENTEMSHFKHSSCPKDHQKVALLISESQGEHK